MKYLAIASCLLASTGCMLPLYEQPPPDQPHAITKIRVVNHDSPGPQLTELFSVGDHRVPLPATEGDYRTPRNEAIRIRLEPARMGMSTKFFHTYTTTSVESYSYMCGKSTCTGSRTVTHTHTVVDGACKAGVSFTPVQNQIYVLQYDFFGHGNCSLKCFEQHHRGDGEFDLRPCYANYSVLE